MHPRTLWLVAMLLTACLDATGGEPVSSDSTTPAAPPAGVDGTVETGRVALGGTVQTVTWVVHDGRAVFEGDIDLGDAIELHAQQQLRAEIRAADVRWPNATIPFEIEGDVYDATAIRNAMTQWTTQTLFQFVPHTTEADYVKFVPASGTVCRSMVGRFGGLQQITLPASCDTAAIVHEIGHLVGLYHEQSRADRDNFITVDYTNIDPACGSSAFDHVPGAVDLFAFDFSSVMLYGSYTCANTPGKPVLRKKADGSTWAAAKAYLSDEDVKAAARLALPYTAHPIHLQNDASEKCLTANNTGSGANVFMYDCLDALTLEQWYQLRSQDGSYHLINAQTGYCLAMQYVNGNWIDQQPCATSNAYEVFTAKVEQTYWHSWKNATANGCLGAPGGSYTLANAFGCNDGTVQMWFTY